LQHDPPPPGTYRATFTLPRELAKDLNHVAKMLGLSQSALLVQLLEQPMADLVRLVQTIPPDAAPPEAARRLRTDSATRIREVVQDALRAADALEGKLPL
jgi:hypothetical protein